MNQIPCACGKCRPSDKECPRGYAAQKRTEERERLKAAKAQYGGTLR